MIPKVLLVHLLPLKWEHINWTGDYHWRRDGGPAKSEVAATPDRPLNRPRPFLSVQFFTKPASDPHFMESGENLLTVERRFRAT